MARIIDVEFSDKKYTIEYNRRSVVEFMTMQNDSDNSIKVATKLIQCGLLKHHEHELPSEDEIVGWVIAMGEDAPKFVEALKTCIDDVLATIKADKENKSGFKWGIRN